MYFAGSKKEHTMNSVMHSNCRERLVRIPIKSLRSLPTATGCRFNVLLYSVKVLRTRDQQARGSSGLECAGPVYRLAMSFADSPKLVATIITAGIEQRSTSADSFTIERLISTMIDTIGRRRLVSRRVRYCRSAVYEARVNSSNCPDGRRFVAQEAKASARTIRRPETISLLIYRRRGRQHRSWIVRSTQQLPTRSSCCNRRLLGRVTRTVASIVETRSPAPVVRAVDDTCTFTATGNIRCPWPRWRRVQVVTGDGSVMADVFGETDHSRSVVVAVGGPKEGIGGSMDGEGTDRYRLEIRVTEIAFPYLWL